MRVTMKRFMKAFKLKIKTVSDRQEKDELKSLYEWL